MLKNNKSIPIIELCGNNKQHRISENSDGPYIYPPIRLNIDASSILSYSTFFATIIVTHDGIAKVIGSNLKEEISTFFPKCILEQFTTIDLKNSNGESHFVISAICGAYYVLYLTENKSQNKRSLLYWNSNLISNYPIIINNDISNPLALFGNRFYCCAIDDDGSIIIIPEKFSDSDKIVIKKYFLPQKDKAINVAFCNFFIFALGLSGKVYRSEYENIEFNIVYELINEHIIWISSSTNRCFAVNKNGKVWIFGDLIDYLLDNDLNLKFKKIHSLQKYNISKAYSGELHSIFQTVEGKLLACGSNEYGELLLSTGPSEEKVCDPELTTVDNASFCIVGVGTTVVFKNFTPLMSPNQNVDIRKFVSKISNNVNYIATQDIKSKRNSYQDKMLQKNINQNDTILKMWNYFIDKISDDILVTENGVIINNKYKMHGTYFIPKKPNKLFKLFQYDKQNYHWEYFEDSFQRLIKETNQSEKDPIPLVLFMDSFYKDINDISSKFTSKFDKYINFGDDISIYAFRDENTLRKSVFLFLYYPDKENHDFYCCESLFIQIYVFLFLICDLCIVVLDELEIGEKQIDLIKKIIKISDMYQTKFIKLDDDDRNFTPPMKKSKQNEKLFVDKSQFLFINKTSNEDLKDLVKKEITFTSRYKYNEGDYLKSFLHIFNSIDFNYTYLPVDLNYAFKYVNSFFPEISELYIFHFDDISNYHLHYAISHGYDILEIGTMKNKTSEEIMQYMITESQKFYPKCDIDFCKLLEIHFLDFAKKFINIDDNYIKAKLDEFSALQIANIKKEISTMNYLSKYEIETIISSHKHFLSEKFFDIVNEKYGQSVLEMIYDKKLNILDTKISEDLKTLSKIFEDYIEKNKFENNIEIQSFDDIGKKRANYIVKETQISRQIKIIINSDKDLEAQIPQDF